MTLEILMATYNSAKYLDAQIASIFQQTHTDFTLIIRDNRSTDSTIQQINLWQARYPHQIYLHLAPVHTDALQNFSALLNLSQADYIAFCDSDDVWLPNKLSLSLSRLQMLEALYGEELPCLVYTDLTPTDESLKPIASSFLKASCLPKRPPTFANQLMRNRITGCTVLCNRALAKLAGPIPSEVIMHDAWLGLVASAFGHIELLDQPTLLYRQHPSNTLGMVPASGLSLARLKKLPLLWKRRHAPHQRFAQARLFFERYQHQLSLTQRCLLEDFLTLPQASLFHKLRLLYKQGLREPTLPWTLYTLLFRL